jgi:hypothetical protein
MTGGRVALGGGAVAAAPALQAETTRARPVAAMTRPSVLDRAWRSMVSSMVGPGTRSAPERIPRMGDLTHPFARPMIHPSPDASGQRS